MADEKLKVGDEVVLKGNPDSPVMLIEFITDHHGDQVKRAMCLWCARNNFERGINEIVIRLDFLEKPKETEE